METRDTQQDPDDAQAMLAGADQARERLAARLRLPAGLYPATAIAVAVQIGAAAWGIAAQSVAGLAVAMGGVAVALGVAALLLSQFRRVNGVRVDGLASQIVLGTGATSSLSYVAGFVVATWSAFETRWWLVAVAAMAGGVGYAVGALRWWHAYRHDPVARSGGASPRVLVGLALCACLGLAVLLVFS